MINSADPDQLASSEANWSGSALFAKAGYIRVQQDKGNVPRPMKKKKAKQKICPWKQGSVFLLYVLFV